MKTERDYVNNESLITTEYLLKTADKAYLRKHVTSTEHCALEFFWSEIRSEISTPIQKNRECNPHSNLKIPR